MSPTQPAGGQAAEVPAVAVRRFGLLSPGTATALGVLVLVLAITTLTLKGFDHQLNTSGTWSGIAIVVMYAGVGLVVARRQPRNPIGRHPRSRCFLRSSCCSPMAGWRHAAGGGCCGSTRS